MVERASQSNDVSNAHRISEALDAQRGAHRDGPIDGAASRDRRPDEVQDRGIVPPRITVPWVSLAPGLRFLRPYTRQVAGATVALLVTASATLALGQGVKKLIDHGFGTGTLNDSLALLCAIVALLTIGTFARFYLVSWVGERVSADLRNAVYAHLVELDPAFFERNAATEIQSRITTDTTLLQTVIGSSVSLALRNALMCVGGLVLMVLSNPRLALLVLVTVPVVVAPIVLFGRQVRRLSRASQDRLADVGSHATESLQQIKTVKAFNHEAQEIAAFNARSEQAFRVAERRIRNRSWLTAVVMLLVSLAIVLLFAVGGHEVLAGRSTWGDLAAFMFYAVLVAGSVGTLSEVVGDLQRAAGAMERSMELLAAGRDLPVASPATTLAMPVRGELELRNVHFRYPLRPQRVVLDDLSMRIGAGETVALVGPSGAGKSTLLELFLRFYDPDAGVVLFDGVDVRTLDPKALRGWLAIVPQQPVLFSGTLRDNIRYGAPSASEAEVLAALAAAQLTTLVDSLPDGLNTRVGEFGATISGGQRQRVAIARAIVRNPRVLLLDEATSALDADSERAVQLALGEVSRDRTTVIVAHRLATVRSVGRIFVMDEGKLVGSGTHDSLLRTSPLYERLASLQFQTSAVDALVTAN